MGRTVKIFLDTGNLGEIREAASPGVIDGVTTNSSLVVKEGVMFRDRIVKILEIVEGQNHFLKDWEKAKVQ